MGPRSINALFPYARLKRFTLAPRSISTFFFSDQIGPRRDKSYSGPPPPFFPARSQSPSTKPGTLPETSGNEPIRTSMSTGREGMFHAIRGPNKSRHVTMTPSSVSAHNSSPIPSSPRPRTRRPATFPGPLHLSLERPRALFVRTSVSNFAAGSTQGLTSPSETGGVGEARGEVKSRVSAVNDAPTTPPPRTRSCSAPPDPQRSS